MKEKIVATLLAAIMTLTPVMAAYDLGDYPSFLFTTGHNLNAYVVAGADAKPADVVGMTDLAVRLAGESYEEVSSSGVEVTGGKKEAVLLATQLNASANFGATLTQDDLAGLQDTKLSLTTATGTEDFDVHDELKLGDTSALVQVSTGLTAGSPDEDFKDNTFLEVGRGTVGYYYVFDDDLKAGYNLSSDVTTDYPLEIDFLGKAITITDVAAAGNAITAQIGDKKLLKAGESITVGGKTVTLESTTTTKAVVSCGGTTKAIAEDATGSLCGLQILVETLIDDEGTTNDQAILVIGTEATKTYTDGDPFIGEDEDDPNWVWDISGLNVYTSTSIKIGILFDQTLDEAGEVINLPGKLCLPDNYICIDLNSYVEKDYQMYTVENAREDLYPAAGGTTPDTTSAYVIRWHAAGGGKDGFLLGTEKADDVAIYLNATHLLTYYKDPDDNKFKLGGTPIANGTAANGDAGLTMEYQDSSVPIKFGWGGLSEVQRGNMTIVTDDGSDIVMYIEESGTVTGFDYLGHSDSDTTYANDLKYGTRDISSWEEDTRAQDGIVIKDPKAHLSGDSFDFNVDGDETDFKVNVIITGPTGTTTTEGGDVIKKVVPVTNAVAKLDSEVSLPVNKNLVLVGGPGVNKLSAQAMGLTYPTYGSSGLLPFASGEGYIKVFDGTLETGYVAVVLAGWEAQDTRNACSVLQQYGTFKTQLDGNVAVKVTSVTASGITPA